jgi:hypothetical protein
MKYKSLRFFIAINSLFGWATIVIGCLFSLIWAIAALAHRSVSGFLEFLIIGGSLSAIAGMFIFALRDLYQCFIDIEENTRTTASVSKEAVSNKASISVHTDLSRQESSPGTVTYMCPHCNRFQNSDVIKCENCGAAILTIHQTNQTQKHQKPGLQMTRGRSDSMSALWCRSESIG